MKKTRLLCHAAIVFVTALGLFLNMREPNRAAHTLLYFTAQSNFWLMGVSGVLLWYESLGRAVPAFWRQAQQMATVSILLTGAGYNLILAPQYARRFGSLRRAYSPSVALLHGAAPALGAVSYFLEGKPGKKRKTWLCLLPPLCYCLWAMVSPRLRRQPRVFDGIDGRSCKFPYFFLDHETNGWFALGKDPRRWGTAWWLLLLSALTLSLGALLGRRKQCPR